MGGELYLNQIWIYLNGDLEGSTMCAEHLPLFVGGGVLMWL